MVNWIELDICTAVLPSCWLRRSSTQPNRNTANSTKVLQKEHTCIISARSGSHRHSTLGSSSLFFATNWPSHLIPASHVNYAIEFTLLSPPWRWLPLRPWYRLKMRSQNLQPHRFALMFTCRTIANETKRVAHKTVVLTTPFEVCWISFTNFLIT